MINNTHQTNGKIQQNKQRLLSQHTDGHWLKIIFIICLCGAITMAHATNTDNYLPYPYIPAPMFLQLNDMNVISEDIQGEDTVTMEKDGFFFFKYEKEKLFAQHDHPYFTASLSYQKYDKVSPQYDKVKRESEIKNGYSWRRYDSDYSPTETECFNYPFNIVYENSSTDQCIYRSKQLGTDYSYQTSTGVDDGDLIQFNLGKINRYDGEQNNAYTGYGLTLQYNDFDLTTLSTYETGSITDTSSWDIKSYYAGLYFQTGILSEMKKNIFSRHQFYVTGSVGHNKYELKSTDKIKENKTTRYSALGQIGSLHEQDFWNYSVLTLGIKGGANASAVWRDEYFTITDSDASAFQPKVQYNYNAHITLAFKFNLSPRFYYSIEPGYQFDGHNTITYSNPIDTSYDVTNLFYGPAPVQPVSERKPFPDHNEYISPHQ